MKPKPPTANVSHYKKKESPLDRVSFLIHVFFYTCLNQRLVLGADARAPSKQVANCTKGYDGARPVYNDGPNRIEMVRYENGQLKIGAKYMS